MKTTESVAEIIIVFVLIAAICAGIFTSIVWVTFHNQEWIWIVGGAVFVFLLFGLFVNYVGSGGKF